MCIYLRKSNELVSHPMEAYPRIMCSLLLTESSEDGLLMTQDFIVDYKG